MSDSIHHECGIVLLRLLKPLSYYEKKYGTWKYGVQKLYLLLEKQRNRGQDGAGIACLKLNHRPGLQYYDIHRTIKQAPIKTLFDKVQKINPHPCESAKAKQQHSFAGELYLGHLRYGTYGRNTIGYVHPVLRDNNWKSRNLIIAGNFNLTNVDEIFKLLLDIGQHPREHTDTVTILENIGHYLDKENQRLFDKFKLQNLSNKEISSHIESKLNIRKILYNSSKTWDGGYAILGVLGHGDAFAMRDPAGIRPAFFYHNEEVAVVVSERTVIQTVFNAPIEEVREIKPGHAFIVKKSGSILHKKIIEPTEKKSCSFERIYFSRGNDAGIYKERKILGELLAEEVLREINFDVKNTVFSFIPNTAEIAFLGLTNSLRELTNQAVRIEKIAWKDAKLRTFITSEEGQRDEFVQHAYDVTYGVIQPTDTLVVVDDSIVRGTTLQKSILHILHRLSPKRIIVVSSSPQIRYPDCYGIDMTRMDEFIAFHAALSLHIESGNHSIIKEVYTHCKNQEELPDKEKTNCVKAIYQPFSPKQISDKIGELLTDTKHFTKVNVKIIYQPIENLHKACPEHRGDWYFTGNYPTPGGNKVVNKAFINYMEKKKNRSYQLQFFP